MNSKKKTVKKIITIAIIAAVLGGAVFGIVKWQKGKTAETEGIQALSTVTRGDFELTISGSCTVEPYERYEIIPLVNGEITSCPYEVGDYVEEGSVVYTFDKSDALLSLEKQNNSMEKSTLTYNSAMEEAEKLTVKSAYGGRITKMNVEAGDEVNANEVIATVRDDVNLKVTLPFNKEQIAYISKGDTATLSSSAQMSNFTGTVTYVDSTASAASDGSSVYYVTVEFKNPGAVTDGTNLGAQINGQISPGYGTVSFGEEKQIKAEISGTVTRLYAEEGAYITKNSTVATLKSDDLSSSLRRSQLEYNDAKLSLQSQKDALDDYTVTSPISGTVLTKNSKQGDTIDRSNSSVTMMVIGDVSKLKFSLSIDELDIARVSVGQKVKITSDAVENTEFEGEITNISMEGTASNGVTTYDATVTINDPGELKPSMNVDAVVVIESAENAIRIPSSDIQTAMGISYVYIKNESLSDTNVTVEEAIKEAEKSGEAKDNGKSEIHPNTVVPAEGAPKGDMPEGMSRPEGAPAGGMPEGMTPPEGAPADGMPEGMSPPEGAPPEGMRRAGRNNTSILSKLPEAPEGFTTVIIETGIEGDDFTEVISGLEEGQEIYQQEVSSTSTMGFGRMGGMGGGMPGGMPGGMGGGMPGGGRMGPR